MKSLPKSMIRLFLLLLIPVLWTTCSPSKNAVVGDDGIIEIVFLQMNDVYEIAPLSDNTGGMDRVSTLRQSLLKKNPNTFTVVAGDFISPSVLGTLKHEGARIRGRHMVEVLNSIGVDWVVFGNHEFDYDLEDLQARLDESKFTWLAANARMVAGEKPQPFYKNRPTGPEPCPDNLIVQVRDADGTTVNLGVFGVLVNTGRKSYVTYTDHTEATRQQVKQLQEKSDVVVALTHLDIKSDLALAAEFPSVPLWMGGHDHDNMRHQVGKSVVAKADANARTVYIHTLRYDKKSRQSTVRSELRRVDGSIPGHPATTQVVERWEQVKVNALRKAGFEADRKVVDLTEPLDCRDAYVRHQQAAIGQMITSAMRASARQPVDCILLNSGSIRVDDVLNGTLTELDIVRLLPFGGGFLEAEMKGVFLKRVLDTGERNKSGGGYLQRNGVEPDASGLDWLIGGVPLDPGKTYRVMLPEFLLTGNESNMEFLKTAVTADGKGTDNPGIVHLDGAVKGDASDLRSDVRLALIRHLRGN